MATITQRGWNAVVRMVLTSGAVEPIYLCERATEEEADADAGVTAAEIAAALQGDARWFWPRRAIKANGGIWTADLSAWRVNVEEA
jgi:hypothetical protein